MGVDTKAVLPQSLSPIEIAHFLENSKKFSRPDTESGFGTIKDVENIRVVPTHDIDFNHVVFDYKGETRILCVFSEGNCKGDYAHLTSTDGTILVLGCWGHSVEIMKVILDEFGGGWIDENDSDEIDYLPFGPERNFEVA